MRLNGARRQARPEQVLGELEALSDAQLDRLLPQVFALRARRGRHVLGKREGQLLEHINRPLPAQLQKAYHRLNEKRRSRGLTETEAKEFHQVTDRLEMADARRLECLVELAGLRKTTLEKLMRSLGLKTPAYA